MGRGVHIGTATNRFSVLLHFPSFSCVLMLVDNIEQGRDGGYCWLGLWVVETKDKKAEVSVKTPHFLMFLCVLS